MRPALSNAAPALLSGIRAGLPYTAPGAMKRAASLLALVTWRATQLSQRTHRWPELGAAAAEVDATEPTAPAGGPQAGFVLASQAAFAAASEDITAAPSSSSEPAAGVVSSRLKASSNSGKFEVESTCASGRAACTGTECAQFCAGVCAPVRAPSRRCGSTAHSARARWRSA